MSSGADKLMYTAAHCRYYTIFYCGVGWQCYPLFQQFKEFPPTPGSEWEINHFVLCLEFIIIVNMQHFVTHKYWKVWNCRYYLRGRKERCCEWVASGVVLSGMVLLISQSLDFRTFSIILPSACINHSTISLTFINLRLSGFEWLLCVRWHFVLFRVHGYTHRRHCK